MILIDLPTIKDCNLAVNPDCIVKVEKHDDTSDDWCVIYLTNGHSHSVKLSFYEAVNLINKHG